MSRGLSIAVACLLIAAVPARAEDAPAKVDPAKAMAFDAKLIGGAVGKTKTYACFVRSYDPAHLAAHPKQKVSAMKLLVEVDAPAEQQTYSHNFKLGVKFRHRTGDFQSSGFCNHASVHSAGDEVRLHCGVDCEGGGIEIGIAAGKPAGEAAAMVRLEAVRIWNNDSKDEEDAADYLKAGSDDKAFRLERTSTRDCESLVTDSDELQAFRKQLAITGNNS
ncbi:hypothetical protein BH11PSE4_BH11PSE4_06330 [soil metagenome]